MIVASYLIRMEPFTQHFLKLQVCWFKCICVRLIVVLCVHVVVWVYCVCVQNLCGLLLVVCTCLEWMVCISIPYNQKHWRSLNLAVCLKLGVQKILVEVKFCGGAPVHYIIISITRVIHVVCQSRWSISEQLHWLLEWELQWRGSYEVELY